jgi:succinate dehydrogenase/fumarate reductase flavoprotein subunit
VTKPDKRYGDMTIEVNKALFDEYRKSGKGPVYMDMNGISKRDLAYMVHWLQQEGNEGILSHIAGEGIDLGKSAIEFQTFEMESRGGIRANFRGETAVKGLYAAGDEVVGTISHAAVFGRSAGENAARHAKTARAPNIEAARPEIEAKKARLEEIRNREDGARWQEAVAALQQIMSDYCGYVRSETLLRAGLNNMRRLKTKAYDTLMAGNAHDLMYCLQSLNQMDIGELVFISADDRKETRDLHVRTDYGLTNPLLSDRIHLIRQADGRPVIDWVEVKH